MKRTCRQNRTYDIKEETFVLKLFFCFFYIRLLLIFLNFAPTVFLAKDCVTVISNIFLNVMNAQ